MSSLQGGAKEDQLNCQTDEVVERFVWVCDERDRPSSLRVSGAPWPCHKNISGGNEIYLMPENGGLSYVRGKNTA